MSTKLVVLAKIARSVYKMIKENEDLIPDLTTLKSAMTWHGMWPTESEMNHNYGRYKLKVAVSMLLCGFSFTGLLLHIIKVRSVDPNADLNEAWSVLLTLCATIFAWASFVPNVLVADRALRYLVELYKRERPLHLRRSVQRLSVLYSISYFLMMGGAILYSLQQVVNKCGGQPEDKCGLLVPFWMPLDSVYIRLVIGLVQFLTIFVCTAAAAVASLYAFAVTVHVVICLRHLVNMAETVVVDGKMHRGKMRKLVQYHQCVIHLMDIINEVASGPLCVHLLVSSTLLGVLIHNILNQNLKSIIGPFLHLIFYLSSFLLNCIGGQWILDESTQLSTEMYSNIKWYELDVREMRDVLIVIVRCQKPLLLRTGSISYMSLKVFTQVIKGIYYMSLLDIVNIYK